MHSRSATTAHRPFVNMPARTAISVRSRLQAQLRSTLETLAFPASDIPLKRDTDNEPVQYRSAIALKLAPQLHQSPGEIARKIAIFLPHSSLFVNNLPSIATPEFTVRLSPPAWIDLALTDTGLANWLQHRLTQASSIPHPTSKVQTPSSPFPIQYAHARCCSLLRLADREGVIAIDVNTLRSISPDPIPWIDARTTSLRLQESAERALVSQLVAVMDALDNPKPPDYFKLATQLSQTFHRFDSQCRIFGAVAMENPSLAQARSGLVSATQNILKCLLEQGLGIVSPMEL